MSTEIKIKRGSGVTPLLADGELGYNKDAKTLSIGTDGGNVTVGRPIQTVTQETYDAMSKDDDTIYLIESDDAVVTQSAMEAYAAPNGFGLGGGAEWLASEIDLNDVTNNGWYTFTTSNANRPFDTGVLLVINRHADGRYCHQIAFKDNGSGSSIQIRQRVSGNWQAWRKWAPEDFASANHTHTAAQVGAAPTGYGLGGDSTYTADCNAIGANGWYYGGTDTANKPCNYFTLLHFYRTSSEANQIAFNVSSNDMYFRFKVSGGWSDWNTINPDNYAPSGYGLGMSSCTAPADNDANNAVYNGLYTVYTSTANSTGFDGVMRVESRSWGQIYQTVAQHGTGGVMQRCQSSGTWGAWEWVNPPLHYDTEYRTTERFGNKAVWQCVIYKGYVSQGLTSFAHGLAIEQAIDIRLMNNAQDITTDGGVTHLTFDATNVSFQTAWNAGGIKMILKYTKP